MKRYSLLLMFAIFPATSVFAFPGSPEQQTLSFGSGRSYDPAPHVTFTTLSGGFIYDYEAVMPHPAPDALKFRIEGSLGAASIHGTRLLASFNFYAMYFLDGLSTEKLHPFIEGGAGVIYNDFQVEGMGLRCNFNPQAGVGFTWERGDGGNWFSTLHAWHISNGGLDHDNRGMNGVVVQVGLMWE